MSGLHKAMMLRCNTTIQFPSGTTMKSFDLQSAFNAACEELGLDPANTNLFELECHRQGRDPKATRMFDLDKNASELWAAQRRLKRA